MDRREQVGSGEGYEPIMDGLEAGADRLTSRLVSASGGGAFEGEAAGISEEQTATLSTEGQRVDRLAAAALDDHGSGLCLALGEARERARRAALTAAHGRTAEGSDQLPRRSRSNSAL